MQNLTELFTPEELDIQMEAAGHLLTKVAEEENLDLSKLSQDDLADLLGSIIASNTGAQVPGVETPKVASQEPAAPAGEVLITVADAALELSKIAAAEGVDLPSLSREEYADLLQKVAEMLADPEYHEQVKAAQEEQAKLAAAEQQMDHLGRVVARGFIDELNKVAAETEEKPEGEDDEDEDKDKEASAQLREHIWAKLAEKDERSFAERLADRSSKMRANVPLNTAAGAALGGMSGGLIGASSGAAKGMKSMARRGAAGAAAGALGLGALNRWYAKGEKAHRERHGMDKKAEFLEAAALERAQQFLLEQGIDPSTGAKLASDESGRKGFHETLADTASRMRAHKGLQTGAGALVGGGYGAALGALSGHGKSPKAKALRAALGAALGGAGLGALGYYGAKGEQAMRDRLARGGEKKAEFLEAAALERAQQFLLSQGIDPSTGEKLASDEEVDALAIELLREAGYQV